jgi:hypothetical protein
MDDARQPENRPIDEEAISEPVVVDGEERRIGQSPSGSQGSMGGGEFPSPRTEPSESAPGSDPELRREIEERRRTGS